MVRYSDETVCTQTVTEIEWFVCIAVVVVALLCGRTQTGAAVPDVVVSDFAFATASVHSDKTVPVASADFASLSAVCPKNCLGRLVFARLASVYVDSDSTSHAGMAQ